MTLPTYIPLDEAAQRTGWTVERLRAMIEAGTIIAGKLPDGDIIVAVDDNGTAIETPAPVETPAETVAAETEETRPKPERALPLAVAGDDINAQLAAIRREDFEHLEGQGITVRSASEHYGVPIPTLYRWVKAKYVKILHKGKSKTDPSLLNEADVAYCTSVYKIRKSFRSFAPLLDDAGNPYLLRFPELARLRRQAKTSQ